MPKYDLTRGVCNDLAIERAKVFFMEALNKVVEKHGKSILNYSGTNAKLSGFEPLKETIATWHSITPSSIYVTNGGMDANTKVFKAVGMYANAVKKDKIMLSDIFMYDRALQSMVNEGFKVVGVPMDKKGTLPDKLEELIDKTNPIAFWTQPCANNPTGANYDRNRLVENAKVCERKGVIMLIDDAYYNGNVGLTDRPYKIVNLNEYPFSNAILTKNTTKELLPALKIGYIACGSSSKLVKCLIDNVATSSLLNGHYPIQSAWHETIENGEYMNHIAWTNKALHKPRGNEVNKILEERFYPDGHKSYGVADGGFFTLLWLNGVDEKGLQKIIEQAKTYKEGVALQNGILGIAPYNLEQQPEIDSSSGLILPISSHAKQILKEMGGSPLRLAFNHAKTTEDVTNALELLYGVINNVQK